MTTVVEVGQNFIEHYGVKGMHWGVRKDDSGGSAVTRRSPHSIDSAHVENVKAKAKTGGGTHVLSNKEMQDVITRLNLEKQYRTLSAEKSSINAGHKKVKHILGLAKTMGDVYNFIQSPAGKALKMAIKSKMK